MGSYGGRGPTVNAALWTETVVAAIFVVLRVYTRKVILRSFGWDDFFLVVTLVLLVLYSVMITVAYAVAIDFTLAIAPCFILWDLNMTRKDKMLALFGLSLGVFAGVCGILRTTALTSLRSFDEYICKCCRFKFVSSPLIVSFFPDDTSNMLIYSSTENFVSVICASIPVLRPLWVEFRGYSSADDSYAQRGYKMSRFGSQDAEGALGGNNVEGMATRIFCGGRDAHVTNDDASEETTLREMRGKGDTGTQVFCKTDISIDYSTRGVDESRSSQTSRKR
ncbi:hypothetical protein AK830_g10396 [Neonectria ditissima]|uniref:Rhodopsin domain-containing protein n=1 Tax=Neonectria ditissima TaxID=78410 RepID=A0A0N8H5H3_9HYPO|nr:hypothetical protein AK830_g10396 [Neonectria ditissima]